MKELEKEIKRSEEVLEKYSEEYKKCTGAKKLLLYDTIQRTEGVLIGLKTAKKLLEKGSE